MHAQLLTLGFVRTGTNQYFSAEFNIYLVLNKDGTVEVSLSDNKTVTATMTELEDSIMGGGFGGFGV